MLGKINGTQQFNFNLTPLFDQTIGPMVKQLLTLKLHRTGWSAPGPTDYFRRTFYEQCAHYGFHRVLGITTKQFEDWLEGRRVEHQEPPSVQVGSTKVSVSASLLAALATKPFVVMSGPTGTGKTRTVRDLARTLSPTGAGENFNSEFLPVEAGWTDGRHLLGYGISRRRACALVGIWPRIMRYESVKDPQDALRIRLKDLAAIRVRYGYRRLHVLLEREGWEVNHKRVYRLYW